jgi:hypothetical protein
MNKIDYWLVGGIIAEMRRINSVEALEEAQKNFLRARRKGEIFRLDSTGQSKISSMKWKK